MDGRVLQLLVLSVVITAVWGVDRAEIAFKSCKTPSGIPKCKVKTVFVEGCQKERTHDMNHIPRAETNAENWRRGLRKSTCDVNKKTQLNFTIAIHSGFSTDRLYSQFTLADTPRPDCTPEGGASHCLFREYVRNGCRGNTCPIGVDITQEVTDYIKINPDSSIAKKAYNVQWKLWNKSNKKENCCFVFKLRYF
ncbi:uncharacterized protein LOC128990653 [Macrosteles quadrilineatus]|uniref:uncharacterized protein LOC128990653 n=1 Tax=Macrosteles quadrilineatus TaxID=74068 RepID=UPI0023E2E64F|nr:uncharacterized protein LOC128990653 [Macrosteles quadrilineatus]